jgi:hypothetical protein
MSRTANPIYKSIDLAEGLGQCLLSLPDFVLIREGNYVPVVLAHVRPKWREMVALGTSGRIWGVQPLRPEDVVHLFGFQLPNAVGDKFWPSLVHWQKGIYECGIAQLQGKI